MKLLKMISITILLLILCIGKPLKVDAAEDRSLESCERNTLINIFKKGTDTGINATTDVIAEEYSNNICDCSYYDCKFDEGNNYDEAKLIEFLDFAEVFFNTINTEGNIGKLKQPSDKNKNITNFEELVSELHTNSNINELYDCIVDNNCSETTTPGGGETTSKDTSCSGIFGQDTANLFKEILNYIRILGPLAVIIYSALDLAYAVAGKYQGNEDALEIAKQKIKKRILALLLLFFLPTILRIIFIKIEDDLVISSECIMFIKNMILWR